MGCNMCVVNRPEEQYRVMLQKKGWSDSLRPIHGNTKARVRRPSQLPLDRPQSSQEPLHQPGSIRKGHKRKGGRFGCHGNGTTSSNSIYSVAMVTIPDCVDSGTQTDISFQHLLTTLGGVRGHRPPPPSPPAPSHLGVNELGVLDSGLHDYLDVCHHEVDGQEELQYEEVALYKSSQQQKLGLTVCYRTEEAEDLGIYVGEVNPDGIAALNGHIREGDRILQINGVDVQSREEAVAILTREDSINFSLLLARPDIESNNPVTPGEEDEEMVEVLRCASPSPSQLTGCHHLQRAGQEEEEEEDEWRGAPHVPPPPPRLSLTPLLEGGGGEREARTVPSPHHHEGELDSSRRCRPVLSPRPSPRPSPRDHIPPLLHLRELQLSSDSLPALDRGSGGGYSPLHLHKPRLSMTTMTMMMPGLTEEECDRYRELLEIRSHLETRSNRKQRGGEKEEEKEENNDVEEEERGEDGGQVSQHQVALMEEELRHLEFKCRNILRAQKMLQLRERCLKTWVTEDGHSAGGGVDEADGEDRGDDGDAHRHELSAINELPERERSDEKDSTSAYNTGGESCQSTPLVSTEQIPPLPEGGVLSPPPRCHLPPFSSPLTPRRQGRVRRQSSLNCSFSPNSYRKFQTDNGSRVQGSNSPSKFRSLTREAVSSDRRSVGEGSGAGSAESSPYLSRRRRGASERYQSCVSLPCEGLPEGEERAAGTGSSGSTRSVNSAPCDVEDRRRLSRSGLALQLGLARSPQPSGSSQRTEWKVKLRSDGTRYVAKRPVRDRLLKARAMKIREERSIGMTTDDDAVSEMKQGRYWSKEERKQQLLRAREYRRRREFMMQSRLDYVRGERDLSASAGGAEESGWPQEGEQHTRPEGPHSNILLLSQKKIMKKRSRRILDNWITIQELLAHGSRSPNGKKIYNPLLSVTTV